MFEEVGVRKDGEYDDDNNNSPLMSGILTRPGAELKPDWTAVWWKHVLAAVLGHILYLKDKMLFFFKNIACGSGVRRCVEREFLFELRATVQRMDQTKTLREGDWECASDFYLFAQFLFWFFLGFFLLFFWHKISCWDVNVSQLLNKNKQHFNLLHWINLWRCVFSFY